MLIKTNSILLLLIFFSMPVSAESNLHLLGYSSEQLQARHGDPGKVLSSESGNRIELYKLGDISATVEFRNDKSIAAAYITTTSVPAVFGPGELYELTEKQISLILASYYQGTWITLRTKFEFGPRMHLSENEKYSALQKGVMLIVSGDKKQLDMAKELVEKQAEYEASNL